MAIPGQAMPLAPQVCGVIGAARGAFDHHQALAMLGCEPVQHRRHRCWPGPVASAVSTRGSLSSKATIFLDAAAKSPGGLPVCPP